MKPTMYELDISKIKNENTQQYNLQNGMAKLVLSLIKALNELLERQALRRFDAGALSDYESENLGLAFISTKMKIQEIADKFGLKSEDLNLTITSAQTEKEKDLPLQQNQVSLVEILDKIIDKGVLVGGDVIISVANVDLISINLLATISSIERLDNIRRVK